MKFVFVTDLHGWEFGYDAVLEYASSQEVDMVVNGGDMLPKGKSLEGSLARSYGTPGRPEIFDIQSEFISSFLSQYIERCASEGIRFYGMFGNDDVRCNHDVWLDLVRSNELAFELSLGWNHLEGGLWIRGCPFVPDVPFRLKDWSAKDSRDYRSPPQMADPVQSCSEGVRVIGQLDQFLNKRPTIEDLLAEYAGELDDEQMSRGILVGHSPPAGTGLGIIHDGLDVGSRATAKWIRKYQPLLTLHGHIHESPQVSGTHTTSIGRTVCHNPGQFAPDKLALSLVTIDDEDVKVERILIKANNR